jgi:hypothetical protein
MRIQYTYIRPPEFEMQANALLVSEVVEWVGVTSQRMRKVEASFYSSTHDGFGVAARPWENERVPRIRWWI